MLCHLSLAIALLTPCVQAQGALDAPLQRRVNEAIDDGVDALLAQQELDGSWRIHQDRYPGGMTALTAYALIKSGVKRDHQALRRAFGFLRSHPPEKTYSAACQLLAFAALGDPAEQGRIQDLADLLLSWHKSGGFGYPDGRMELSNTQYPALALRAAAPATLKSTRALSNFRELNDNCPRSKIRLILSGPFWRSMRLVRLAIDSP